MKKTYSNRQDFMGNKTVGEEAEVIRNITTKAMRWIFEGNTIKQDHPIVFEYYKRWSGNYRMDLVGTLAYHIYGKTNNILLTDDIMNEAKDDLKNLMLSDIDNAGMSLIVAQDEVDNFFKSIEEFICSKLFQQKEKEDKLKKEKELAITKCNEEEINEAVEVATSKILNKQVEINELWEEENSQFVDVLLSYDKDFNLIKQSIKELLSTQTKLESTEESRKYITHNFLTTPLCKNLELQLGDEHQRPSIKFEIGAVIHQLWNMCLDELLEIKQCAHS